MSMKRPMMFCGIAALLLSIIAQNADKTVMLFVAIALFCSAVCFVIFGKRFSLYRFVPLLLVLFLISGRCFLEMNKINKAKAFSGRMDIVGTVTDVDYYDESVAYTVNTDDFKIRIVSTKGVGLVPGEEISARVHINKSLKTDYSYGTYASAFLKELHYKKTTDSIFGFLYKIRVGIRNILFYSLSGDEAAMLLGLTVGDKQYLSDEVSNNIRNAGASHIMVVSGLHLGIIVGTFLKIAKKKSFSMRITGIIGIAIILFLIAITGFTSSVIRSGVTYLIILAGMFLHRKSDSVNSLFAAVTILVAVNPFVCNNISFQLSCSATFGVIVIAPAIFKILTAKTADSFADKMVRTVMSIVSVALGANLATLPFSLWHFGSFSAVSLLTNLFTTHLVTVALILAVLGIATCFAPFVSKIFLLAAGVCAKIILFLLNSLGSLPYAIFEVAHNKIFSVLTACFVFVFTFILLKLSKKRSDTVGNSV